MSANIFLSTRQKGILGTLYFAESWVNGTKLSKEFGVTDRTIRTDIKIIKQALEGSDNEIVTSRKNGYCLKVNRTEGINELLYRGNQFYSPDDRVRQIIITLLNSDQRNPLTLEELVKDVAISASTLNSTLIKIKKYLRSKDSSLRLIKKSNFIWIEGQEENRRRLLLELIINQTNPSYIAIENYHSFFDALILETIEQCIKQTQKKYDFSLIDLDFNYLLIYLAVKCNRVDKGYLIGNGINELFPVDKESRVICDDVVNNLEYELGLVFNEPERYELLAHLTKIRIISRNRPDRMSLPHKKEIPDLEYILNGLLLEVKNKYCFDLTQDNQLKVGLLNHIRYLFNKRDGSPKSVNPILNLLKTEYPFSFEISLFLYERFYDLFKIPFSEDDLGYIAAHIGAAKERKENLHSVDLPQVALITDTSISASNLLIARIKTWYADKFNIIGPYSLNDKHEIFSMMPMAVLTTTSKKYLEDCPTAVYKITPLLNDDDLIVIKSMMEEIKNKLVRDYLPLSIRSYFDESLFFTRINASTFEEVLSYMASKLAMFGYVDEMFLEKTLFRESISPTTFGNMLAMPHPIDSCSKKTVIAIGILDKPILWHSAFVQLIFMLSVKKEDLKYMSHFFDITVGLVDKPEKVGTLIQCNDFEKFMELLLRE